MSCDFTSAARDGSGKADAFPASNGRIAGGLYELSEDQFARLDEFERGYRRAALSVATLGEARTAFVYSADDRSSRR